MKKKYQRYIEYIVSDLQPPYFINMENEYGLRSDEYKLILSKVFNQPVNIKGRSVYDSNDNKIYYEVSNGFWEKFEYDSKGNKIYYEDGNGFWKKREYDQYGNKIYYENSDGYWHKKEYDTNGKLIYYEDSNGYIMDNR